MIDPQLFSEAVRDIGILEVVGVPDSLLKSVLGRLERAYGPRFKVVANEGAAIGHAIGSYAASGSLSLVFMQNSGLGNAINPLVSLAHPGVFGCPMILLIGWRGELFDDGQQIEDEPQHLVQGRITRELLELLDIPTFEMPASQDPREFLNGLEKIARQKQGPVAVLVRKGTFSSHNNAKVGPPPPQDMSREEAISAVLSSCSAGVPVVAATGMIGREVYELQQARGQGLNSDLLVVGAMGHASSIAAGVGLDGKISKVVCLDGDGGVLMHMGALPHVAQSSSLVHIVLNNGVHDSVGGQRTVAKSMDFHKIADGAGYGSYRLCTNSEEISHSVEEALTSPLSSFLELLCRPGYRPDLGRPVKTPGDNFASFSSFLTELRNR